MSAKQLTQAEKETFCVVYRTGGTENYKWHRTLGMTKDEADKAKDEIEHGGRKAYTMNLYYSMIGGLPESYE